MHDLPVCTASILKGPQGRDPVGDDNGVDGNCDEQGQGEMTASDL